jgi:hypothetical protein
MLWVFSTLIAINALGVLDADRDLMLWVLSTLIAI